MPHKAKITDKQRRIVYGVLLAGSLLGALASLVLSHEAVVLAREANAVLSCDLNSVVSCGAVARHASAYIFGIPNSFIGMLAMPVFVTIAVAGISGTIFPRWFLKAAQLGAIFSLLCLGWMFYMSYVVIGALCPWCLVMDVAFLLIVYALIRYNALTDNLCLKGRVEVFIKNIVQKNYDAFIFLSIAVLAISAIILKYGSQLF
jgi:hypothetical protein